MFTRGCIELILAMERLFICHWMIKMTLTASSTSILNLQRYEMIGGATWKSPGAHLTSSITFEGWNVSAMPNLPRLSIYLSIWLYKVYVYIYTHIYIIYIYTYVYMANHGGFQNSPGSWTIWATRPIQMDILILCLQEYLPCGFTLGR